MDVVGKKKKIKIFEVGARDGLQNERVKLSPRTRVEFIHRLITAGVRHLEFGAFVSERWVPQMAGTQQVGHQLLSHQKSGLLPKSVCLSALVPNPRGMELALECGVREVAIFGAASETFSQRNIHCSIAESIQRYRRVIEVAHQNRVRVRAYISTAFGCPFEGKVRISSVLSMAKKWIDLGAYEVSLGDTIGAAHPGQVRQVLDKLLLHIPPKNLAMHFHDTRGTGLANVLQSLEYGISCFDSSLGGLGGCPYAPAATGNVATEDLLYMLHGMGYKTGINLEALLPIHKWIGKKVKRSLPSRLGQAGLPQ